MKLVNATEPHYWEVNIGSGYGLMLLGNRQQAITWANADPSLCYHVESLDHNE